MESKLILLGLEDLARRLGLTVRYERLGDEDTPVRSGRCRLKGRDFLLVDRGLDAAGRIEVLVSELREMNLGGIYIKPYLRACLGLAEDDWD